VVGGVCGECDWEEAGGEGEIRAFLVQLFEAAKPELAISYR
jgi:hypothetical protein